MKNHQVTQTIANVVNAQESKRAGIPAKAEKHQNICYNLEIQEMMRAIRSLDDPSFFKFVSLLRQEYEYEEIMKKLGLDFDGVKDYYFKYLAYKNKYLDE